MGNPFIHIDLQTDDVARTKDFYGRLFDWKFEERVVSPSITFTIVRTGSGPTCGILPRQLPQAPTTWVPYAQVDSVEATMRKVRQVGAKILLEKLPIPGVGAIGVFYDPSGAPVGIRELKR